ncbi:hypothetical protein L195_g061785, partial [Trifolium pratense]
ASSCPLEILRGDPLHGNLLPDISAIYQKELNGRDLN